jgi:RNA polymerase sigma-70 factor, ECF subfamily
MPPPAELTGAEPRDVAIPRLVDAEAGRLYALGLRFCGDPDEARDLMQETFLQAWRKWDGFEGRSSPATWLYTIAARVCQRFRRKRSGEPERIESLDELLPFGETRMAVVPDPDEGPLAERVRAEARERVEEAIAGLPVAFRMPLVLKEIVGLGVADVAAVLGLKEATVKTRLHRARLRVRAALEEALPWRDAPPPAYSRQVCLDLLRAKQEALDRGVPFRVPGAVVCERCAALFGTLDLGGELCREIAAGRLPDELRAELLARLARAG